MTALRFVLWGLVVLLLIVAGFVSTWAYLRVHSEENQERIRTLQDVRRGVNEVTETLESAILDSERGSLPPESTSNSGGIRSDQADRLWTIQEAVSPIAATEYECWPPQDSGGPPDCPAFEFLWGQSYWSPPKWNGPAVFVTCHRYGLNVLIRLYFRQPGELDLQQQFCFGWGHLDDPETFRVGDERFFLFRHNSPGSASLYSYRVIWAGDPGNGMRTIAIETPTKALVHLLEETQHSCATRTHIEAKSVAPRFSFSIWNPGDLNNFPTGGHVTGSFKLVRDSSGAPFEFVVDLDSVSAQLTK